MANKKQISNKIRSTRGDKIFNAVNCVVLLIISLLVLYPMYLVVIASFSDPYAVTRGEVLLWPKDFNVDGYKRILQYEPIWRGYLNTIIYTVGGIVVGTFVTLLAAYALTRKFRGKKFVTLYFVFTMLFNGGIIPTFLMVKSYGLYNTRLIMILLGSVAVWNLMVARTYLQQNIPEELHESAILDGCDHFTYFFRIVIPLSKIIIAVLVIYYGISQWNEYMRGVIYLRDSNLKPLQVVIRNFLTASQMSAESSAMLSDLTDWGEIARVAESLKYSVIVVATAPMLVLYLTLQKYFVQGVMVGSLKG